MADHSELKRLVEQGSLPPIVSTLIAEIDRLTGFFVHRRAQEKQYDEALIKVAGQRDQLKAENDRLTKAVGIQVNRRFVGDDDQKNIDELVAAGIQVDKELIAQLRAELQEAYSLIGGIVLAVGAPVEGELSDWVEALREDAARYRWLRDSSESIHQFYLSTPIWFTGVKFSKENVDNTIDAAMSKESSHD